MASEVRRSLRRRPLPEIPSKYFYDDRGSALFDRITRLPEYYLTRAEEALLEKHASEVIEATRPRELVEIGSGAGRKIRMLLDAIRASRGLESVVLFDINETAVRSSLERLQDDYPEARFAGVVGDFGYDLGALGTAPHRLLLFLASTIGNLHPDALPAFFRGAAAVLDGGDAFLVGVDTVKDKARLHAAYNDAAGITAEFNRNVLRALNHRLGADFDPADFDHVAFYDEENEWVEMRLRARRALIADIPPAAIRLELAKGDEIRTELSCKYTAATFAARLDGSGFALERWITDPSGSFASVLLRRV